MTDAVNTIGGGSVTTPVTPRAPAASLGAGSKTGTSAPAPSSSRLYDDPLAGVLVTEQLNANGQVVSQNPPGAVLAYLRNGLTIDGQAKQTATA